MKIDNSFALISRVKESFNAFLEKKLREHSFNKIVTSHGDIIAALAKSEELTMSEIAKEINRDRSTVTALVNKLKKLGYLKLKENEQDLRSSLVSLTDKGQELIPAFKKISVELFEKASAGISEKEWQDFRKTLEKLFNNLK
jgi:MarR family transcriptional regulator, organic hydroperoxide resistance regulator